MSKQLNKKELIKYVDVIIPLALPKLLSYQLKVGSKLNIGQRVLVNIGKKKHATWLACGLDPRK